jgi:hypothetical protein
MSQFIRFIYLLLGTLTLSALTASGQVTFRGRVIDAETQLPLAATVSVTNGEGRALNLDGEHDHVFYLGKKRWYVDGEFSITTDEDSLFIEIRHGLETFPVSEIIYPNESSTTVREFKLKRWVNMIEMGFMSGDSHVHFLGTKQAHLQMQAEDLNVVNILTSDFTHDAEKFTGKLDPVSTEGRFVYVGQEFRDWQMGHVNYLDLKFIVQPLDVFGGTLFQMGSNPNLVLSPRLEEARGQDAATVWAHFTNLPGLESAIAFPLGLIDAVELMTYDDPTKPPSHQTAWDYTDLSQVEFPALRGMDLYYQYLNAGFQLPITAGTDKMGDNIPVGSNRHYARYDGEATYDHWIEGLKSGRGFVTNGPMLSMTVDDHLSGETINFKGEKTVTVKIKAESILPFGRLEIIANGRLIAWEYIEGYTRSRDLYTVEMEKDITLDESTWIACRVTSLDTPQMLPRNLTVFAHTNPVYFLKDNKPVHNKASIKYLLDYLKSGRNWIENHSSFKDEAEKEAAMTYLEKAEKILKEK